ncbi:MAG: hypothetical protein C0465_21045 [Ralstonia sp.]|nr:hypothetical protein [Ralstonia sp.]
MASSVFLEYERTKGGNRKVPALCFGLAPHARRGRKAEAPGWGTAGATSWGAGGRRRLSWAAARSRHDGCLILRRHLGRSRFKGTYEIERKAHHRLRSAASAAG